MLWFTADCHFGHKNILTFCHRPFQSVEHMAEGLIFRWNSCVKPNDTVYHIGDFCLSNKPEEYLSRLNGNIVLINGSHDTSIKKYRYPNDILIIKPLNDEYGNPREIVLCHYAMRSWYKSHYASWHLFGHHHGMLEPYGLSFDVGVDTNNFYPYSLNDVATKMQTLTPIVDYR